MSNLTHTAALMGLTLILFASPLRAMQGDGEPEFYFTNPKVEEFVRQALDSNPEARQKLAEYRAAIQKIPQVTALPDPMLTFTRFVRSVETRVGPQVSGLMLSQKFPWFGTLDLRGKLALRDASALYHGFRAFERNIAASIKDTFYELAYVDRARQITLQDQSLLTHYEQLAQSRYATGGGLQQAVIKIQAEITKTLSRLALLNQQRESVVARLNALRNRRPEEPVGPVETLPLPPAQLDLEELYELGEMHRPEIRATLDMIEQSQLAIELAKKGYWPDVTISTGLVDVGGREDPAGRALPPPDSGKNIYNFSVGINIPIRRDKYRAAVVGASETLVAHRNRYTSLRNKIRLEVREQTSKIEMLREQLNLYEQVLTPQAESALRSTEAAYETGQLGALDLLDSERTLLEIRLSGARHATDYLRALARLELALGTRFPLE
jgi:cobalt-zinc-cadmium efflux system outer membrane protein